MTPDTPPHEIMPGVALTLFRGEHDGVPVIQLDTEADIGHLRINLNDGPALFDGDPDVDDAPAYQKPASAGIILDATSLREELREAAHRYDIDEDQLQNITTLSDAQLNAAVTELADDRFWHEYDRVRSQAIDALVDGWGR